LIQKVRLENRKPAYKWIGVQGMLGWTTDHSYKENQQQK